ncbi:hypothetical protein A0H81_07913 [Grifola frondosa]|uniref:Uncharacterized protein n=1 Tax=Grifola frondosa TaxID=5627 RepID=A0A1C7M6Q9_GRIFR|nr:hypothetical protein A0H81_07913 [Grifola frondosa]
MDYSRSRLQGPTSDSGCALIFVIHNLWQQLSLVQRSTNPKKRFADYSIHRPTRRNTTIWIHQPSLSPYQGGGGGIRFCLSEFVRRDLDLPCY